MATPPTVTRTTPEIKPKMDVGGHISATTASTGTNFTAFGNVACRQLTVVNNTGVDLEFKQGAEAVYLPVMAGMSYTFYGIKNASELSVRRVDTSNTQVAVKARWEA